VRPQTSRDEHRRRGKGGDHRPHQGRSLRSPLHDPSEVIDVAARIHRKKTVTGLISE
jgi:hypothetical protein